MTLLRTRSKRVWMAPPHQSPAPCASWGFPGSSVVKNPPASARATGSIPGSGRSSGEGNGCLLQYSCLENPMQRGDWQATVPRFAKSQTQLTDWLNVCVCVCACSGLPLLTWSFPVKKFCPYVQCSLKPFYHFVLKCEQTTTGYQIF